MSSDLIQAPIAAAAIYWLGKSLHELVTQKKPLVNGNGNGDALMRDKIERIEQVAASARQFYPSVEKMLSQHSTVLDRQTEILGQLATIQGELRLDIARLVVLHEDRRGGTR